MVDMSGQGIAHIRPKQVSFHMDRINKFQTTNRTLETLGNYEM